MKRTNERLHITSFVTTTVQTKLCLYRNISHLKKSISQNAQNVFFLIVTKSKWYQWPKNCIPIMHCKHTLVLTMTDSVSENWLPNVTFN